MKRMSEPAATRRVRTPSANVERDLLAAAEAVLVRDGPEGLTVRAVAAEARIAPMGVYNRLGGKDGLVDALLIKGFDRLGEALEAHMAGPPASDIPGRGLPESEIAGRFYACGLSYREFALANPHFYAIMFEKAIPRERYSPAVEEHATATFFALVRVVELAAAAGVIAAPDPVEAAQQIWSAVHGAVSLELRGLVQTPDPERTYRDFLMTIVYGLAPH
jgi:AcrR family transcriptional regulator